MSSSSSSSFTPNTKSAQKPKSSLLVRAYVGANAKEYVIHRDRLFPDGHQHYFFISRDIDEFHFKDFDTATFEIFFDWLYTRNINIDLNRDSGEELFSSQVRLYKVCHLAVSGGFDELWKHCLDIYVHLSELNRHKSNPKIIGFVYGLCTGGPSEPASTVRDEEVVESQHLINNRSFNSLVLATAIHGLKTAYASKYEIASIMKKHFSFAVDILEELATPGRHGYVEVNVTSNESYNPSLLMACDHHCKTSCGENCFSRGLTFKESYQKRIDAAEIMEKDFGQPAKELRIY